MTVYYISAEQEDLVQVGTDDLVIVAETGSIQATTDNAVEGNEFGSDVAASVYGSVYGQVTGVQFGGERSTVFVGATGTVEGGETGIEIGLEGIVRNAGQIGGGTRGVYVTYIDAAVTNSGTIAGAIGIESQVDFTNKTIVNNFGTISGVTAGILLHHESNITNHGTIEALGGAGSVGVSFKDVITGTVFKFASQGTLTNRGTIIGETAVEGGSGTETIINEGHLLGNVSLMAGNDWFDGRGGTVVGTIDLGSGDDTAFGGSGVDLIFGGDDNDEIHGEGGRDILNGGAGNDLLDGGAEADALTGGLGDDTYVIDDEGDSVSEIADEGSDTVRASISYTLGADVENLVLTGTAGLSGTGNALANIITGNAGDNLIDGGAGDDTMAGGLGNDTYIVTERGDTVTEIADAGNDTVRASVRFALGANIENLVLTGMDAIDGTGNDLANIITGNGASNILDGGAGADRLIGGDGNDIYIVDHEGDLVIEDIGNGTDTVKASVNYTLGAYVENLVLTGVLNIDGTGNTLANSLTGNSGDNVLDGGAGADNLAGGLGDDTYVVDNEGDAITELVAAGHDTVRASVSYVLSADVEDLVLTGSGDLSGTGNDLANLLTGNAGNNLLRGGGGDDVIDGGLGRDTAVLSGLTTDYDFVANADGSVDVIDKRNGSPDGHDTLRNVESVQFSNGTISLKTPPAPTLQGSAAAIDENAPAYSFVAAVRSNTLAGDEVSYRLLDTLGDRFAIDPATGIITVLGSINYEATIAEDPNLQTETVAPGIVRKFYVLMVQAVSSGGIALPSVSVPVKVYVNNLNEAPTALSFDDGTNAATITGAVANGYVVGTLKSIDPDGDTQLVYSFDSTGNAGSSGSGNAGGLFKIEGGKLKFAKVPTATQAESYTVTLKVTDKNGGPGSTSYYKDFLVNFDPPAPGAIDPVLSIAATNAVQEEGNGGLLKNFTFTVARDSVGVISTAKWTVSGLSIDTDDFAALTGIVEFGANDQTQTITLQVKGDSSNEGNETFTVTLSEPTNATLSNTSRTANGTILDDDAQRPILSIATSTAAVTEGNDGFVDYTFTVMRTGALSEQAEATWSIATGTGGISESDFGETSGLVHFDANQTSKDITIKVKGDVEVENDEAFTVALTAIGNVQLGQGTANGTIRNDDQPAPSLSIATTTASVTEGNAGTTDYAFTVTRANPAGDSTVKWAIAAGNGITAEDFEVSSGLVTFTGTDTSKTIVVKVKGDLAVEADETFTVALTEPTGATITQGTATGKILNDDQPTVVNHAPTDITLTGPASAAEYAAAGTVLGTLSAIDSDAGDSFTYTLAKPDDRFAISGNQLVVKNGFKLDFEQATSHSVSVHVTDAAGASVDKTFTIGVNDVNPEFTLGSADNDVFKGGAGADKLGGGAGDDILWGGLGKDTLTGGTGKDIFVFHTKANKRTNLDKIVDFNVKDDTLWLDNAVFTKLGRKGSELAPAKLNKAFFTIGDKAKDANDYLVYNKAKGVLYYDIDGSGGKAAVEIATLKKNLKMTYKDFFII